MRTGRPAPPSGKLPPAPRAAGPGAPPEHDIAEALRCEAGEDQTRLPSRLVAAIIGLCALPFLLQVAGVGGGSEVGVGLPGTTGTPLELSGHLVHTILEWTAVCLAAFIALLAMLRYSLQRDATAPVIGIALLCAASMDAFHLQATQSAMYDGGLLQQLAPYTWLLSRLFTGLALGLGGWALLLREPPLQEPAPPTRRPVLRTVTVLVAVTISAVLLPGGIMAMGLPQVVFPEAMLPRAYELLPAAVFACSGWFIFRRLHRTTQSVFAHALLVSTVPQVATQLLLVMSSTGELDGAAVMAHGLKLLSYCVLLSGVLMDYTHTHRKQLRELAQRRVAEREARAFAEVAARADQAKTSFLAAMSHEIRTPMSGVLGMSELLLDTELNADQRQMAETVQASSESLLELINDILDISKVEAGQLELEEQDLDLRELLDEVVDLLGHKAVEKGLAFHTRLDPSVPALLVGDPGRLRQVLINLVGNALKFTPEGSVELRVEAVDASAADHADHADRDNRADSADRADHEAMVTIRFSVIDTGIGIRPGDELRLFESFTQADASTSRHFGGTGLGLTICRQLSELMGGEVGVLPGQDLGSTFWFTARLPRQLGELRPRLQAPEEAREAPVLVCGVEGGLLIDLTEQLNELGCEVRDVADAAELAAHPRAAAVAILGEAVDAAAWLTLPDAPRLLRLSTDPRVAREVGVGGLVPVPLRASRLCHSLHALLNQTQATSPRAPTPQLPAARVLVVEDNPVNRQVIEMMLGRFGIQPAFAFDGAAGLERSRGEAWDLILMDCQMPGMDGYEATAAIRAEEAPGRRTPIIALTANALSGDRERCLAAGMDDYLSKPVSPEALVDTLAAHLGRAPDAIRSTSRSD